MLLGTSATYHPIWQRERERSARQFRRGRSRFAPTDLGFPVARYGVWDFTTRDIVRDADGRGVVFTKLAPAERLAVKLAPSTAQEHGD